MFGAETATPSFFPTLTHLLPNRGKTTSPGVLSRKYGLRCEVWWVCPRDQECMPTAPVLAPMPCQAVPMPMPAACHARGGVTGKVSAAGMGVITRSLASAVLLDLCALSCLAHAVTFQQDVAVPKRELVGKERKGARRSRGVRMNPLRSLSIALAPSTTAVPMRAVACKCKRGIRLLCTPSICRVSSSLSLSLCVASRIPFRGTRLEVPSQPGEAF